MSKQNKIFKQLEKFIGTWEMDAISGGVTVAKARVEFEWLEGEQFMIERTTAFPPLPATPQIWIDNNPNPITVIIGLDDNSGHFTFMYSDVRGVRRIYQMTLSDKVWKVWGQAGEGFYQRFEGKFSDDGNKITVRIEQSKDNKNWELDFDTIYKRKNGGEK